MRLYIASLLVPMMDCFTIQLETKDGKSTVVIGVEDNSDYENCKLTLFFSSQYALPVGTHETSVHPCQSGVLESGFRKVDLDKLKWGTITGKKTGAGTKITYATYECYHNGVPFATYSGPTPQTVTWAITHDLKVNQVCRLIAKKFESVQETLIERTKGGQSSHIVPSFVTRGNGVFDKIKQSFTLIKDVTELTKLLMEVQSMQDDAEGKAVLIAAIEKRIEFLSEGNREAQAVMDCIAKGESFVTCIQTAGVPQKDGNPILAQIRKCLTERKSISEDTSESISEDIGESISHYSVCLSKANKIDQVLGKDVPEVSEVLRIGICLTAAHFDLSRPRPSGELTGAYQKCVGSKPEP